MTTVAPAAIARLNDDLQARKDCPPSYVFAGIVGDASHMASRRGYHLSCSDIGSRGDGYSTVTSRDRAGCKSHPNMASAWDLHFNTADMVKVTKRLVASSNAIGDTRLASVREFAGTTNGVSVHAYDRETFTDDPNNTGGWDNGHLSHVHLSFYRDTCNEYTKLRSVVDVICGAPITPPDLLGEIMALDPNSADYKRLVSDIAAEVAATMPMRQFNQDGAGAAHGIASWLQWAMSGVPGYQSPPPMAQPASKGKAKK